MEIGFLKTFTEKSSSPIVTKQQQQKKERKKKKKKGNWTQVYYIESFTGGSMVKNPPPKQ